MERSITTAAAFLSAALAAVPPHLAPARAETGGMPMIVATAPQRQAPPAAEKKEDGPSPEERMRRRFPQPIRVGDLLGLPVLDWRDSTIGYIREVVRSPEGKIQLVVPYSAWFGWSRTVCFLGWCRRPVAVPIETVAILGRQVAALEFSRAQFEAAPMFDPSAAEPIGAEVTIRIAITRR